MISLYVFFPKSAIFFTICVTISVVVTSDQQSRLDKLLQNNFTLTVKLGYEIKAQHSNKSTGHGEQSGGKQTNP